MKPFIHLNYSPNPNLHLQLLLLFSLTPYSFSPIKLLEYRTYIIFMSSYILLYYLPRSPHVAKILNNISQEENLRVQIVHIRVSCTFFIISQIFVATLFQGEHSPLLSHGVGHFFFINVQSIVHR